MERIARDVESLHLGVADLDPFLIGPRIKGAFDLDTHVRRRGADQLDDRDAIRQRSGAPVLRGVAEREMFDLVPFRRSRPIVVDPQRQFRFVGQLLQFDLPKSRARRANRGG